MPYRLDFLPFPLSPGRFWRYAALFWGGFAILSYVQVTLWVWIKGGPMPLTDTMHWLVRWALWLGSSPLQLWSAHRYPVRFGRGWSQLAGMLGWHLGFITVLSGGITALEYGLLAPLDAWATGQSPTPADALTWLLNRYSTFVAIYMLVVAGYQLLLASQQNQQLGQQALQAQLHVQQMRAQLEQAQLQALKMQLNPHFLFNTHHTIVGLILTEEYGRAIQMLQALSGLLRTIVDGDEVQVVALRDELAFIERYLQIQQIRYQDRLTVQVEADADVLGVLVPAFILQPLVENAFVHGLERVAGPVSLRLAAVATGPVLTVCIEDNGAGLSTPRPSQGVGLRNTRRRLAQQYGPAARLLLTPTPGGGTTCMVQLPLAFPPTDA